MAADQLQRLEDKVDRLTEAVVHLARIDERQIAAAVEAGKLTQRVSAVEAKSSATADLLKSWINRGIGAWIVAVAAIGVAAKFVPSISISH